MGTLLPWCFADRPTTPPKGSTATPGALPSAFTPLGHLAAHLGSFLFIHSQLLLRSAASDSKLMACCKACPLTPNPFSSLVVAMATKPLHPTSTGSNWVHRLHCTASAARSEYFSLFRSFALPIAASHGTVSSTMNKDLCEFDHSIRSGLRLVVIISGGKQSFWSRSTCIFQSRAVSNRVISIFVVGFTGSCPALTKVVAFENPGIGGMEAIGGGSPSLQDNRQLPQNLIVPPGVTSLGQTGFAANKDMP